MKRHLSEVATWMSSPPLAIHPKASLFEAYNFMIENDVRRLLVVNGHNSLIGIVTLSDVLRSSPVKTRHEREVIDHLLITAQTVQDVMSPDPITVSSDDTVQEAAERMLEYTVSGLPVVDGDRLVGIITESDIFRLVIESWAESSHISCLGDQFAVTKEAKSEPVRITA